MRTEGEIDRGKKGVSYQREKVCVSENEEGKTGGSERENASGSQLLRKKEEKQLRTQKYAITIISYLLTTA